MIYATRSKRHLLVYFFTALMVVFLGVVFANRAVIARQLDSWQLLPRPQGVTELYFADNIQLPAAVKIDSMQNVAFVIHNLEHEMTTYLYRLVAIEDGSATGQVVVAGSVRLGHDESKTVSETIKIPAVSTPRMTVSVELEYQGIPFGSKTPKVQHLEILHWVNVVGIRT